MCKRQSRPCYCVHTPEELGVAAVSKLMSPKKISLQACCRVMNVATECTVRQLARSSHTINYNSIRCLVSIPHACSPKVYSLSLELSSPSLPVSICECDVRTLPSLSTCIQRQTRATTDSSDGLLVHEGQASWRKFLSLGRSQRGYQGRCRCCGRYGRCGRCGRCCVSFSTSMTISCARSRILSLLVVTVQSQQALRKPSFCLPNQRTFFLMKARPPGCVSSVLEVWLADSATGKGC